MAIPATLKPGIVSIYGAGSPSVNGFVPPDSNFLFGVIDQSWAASPLFFIVGKSVMFKEGDVITRIVYSNWPYTLVPEDKIILREEPIP